MKKTIYMSLLALLFSVSCVVESYEKPPKTIIGYRIATDITAQMASECSFALLSQIVDYWLKADQEERYRIEDLYFPIQKIRILEDTIQIVDFCKINTKGKSLSESDWEISNILIYNISEVNVSRMEENQIYLTITDSVSKLESNYTVNFLADSNTCLVSGTGDALLSPFEMQYNKSTYTITQPIKLTLTPNVYDVAFWKKVTIHDGALIVKIPKGDELNPYENISVTYISDQEVTIELKGFQDTYNNFYWKSTY